MGNVRIELLNGSKRTPSLLKNAIYAPDMAFTLISIGRLDEAYCAVSFRKGMYTIHNPQGRVVATVPRTNGLCRLALLNSHKHSEHANVAAVKVSISEAHRKLGPIAHGAIKHAIAAGHITVIDLDMDSKPEFREPCAKAKSARQPFPKSQKSEPRSTERESDL